MVRKSGYTLTYVGIPGEGVQALPSVYVTVLTGDHLFVQPELLFTRISSGGSSLTTIGVVGDVGYLARPSAHSSPYVAASLAYEYVSSAPTLGGPGFGGAVGYRFKVKQSLGIRIEGSFRRWFGDFKGWSEFGLGIGLGAIVE
jgi:hypothetical protein